MFRRVAAGIGGILLAPFRCLSSVVRSVYQLVAGGLQALKPSLLFPAKGKNPKHSSPRPAGKAGFECTPRREGGPDLDWLTDPTTVQQFPTLNIGQGNLWEFEQNYKHGIEVPKKDAVARKEQLLGWMWEHYGGSYDLAVAQKIYLMMSMVMMETADMRGRDVEKDEPIYDPMARNVTSFNVNLAFLKHFTGCGPSANFQDEWHTENCKEDYMLAIRAIDTAFNTVGMYGALNYHRGGETGWKDPSQFSCDLFRTGLAWVYTKLTQNPSLLTDNHRVWARIEHV